METPEGNGSGVVFDDFGNIVTNYHVLANVIKGLGPAAVGKKVKVASVTVLDTSNRNRSFDAYLVGYDRSKDIAVISIQVANARMTSKHLTVQG